MTGYEAVSLFFEIANTATTLLVSYISVLSAFLIMSFFAADKLSNILITIVLSLFSLTCVLLIIQINLTRNDMSSLYGYILELRNTGVNGLQWFGVNPSMFVDNVPFILNIITIGGYLGCIVFFFYKKNAGTTAYST
jgi:hypothetical protein